MLNKHTIIGIVGTRGVEPIANGKGAKFSVQTWETRHDGSVWTDYTSCQAWGKDGERALSVLRPGMTVMVEGPCTTRKVAGRDGGPDKYYTSTKADHFTVEGLPALTSPPRSDAGGGGGGQNYQQRKAPGGGGGGQPGQAAGNGGYGGGNGNGNGGYGGGGPSGGYSGGGESNGSGAAKDGGNQNW